MNCKEFHKQIISHLDGKLDQSLANELNQHFLVCKNCERDFRMLAAIYRTIDDEKAEFNPNSELSTKVLLKVTKVKHYRNEITLKFTTITALAAAGIALGILIGSLYSNNSASETFDTTQNYEQQLADEYLSGVDNNPYNLITIVNETPSKP